jgi:hypothetical protein
MQNQRNSEQSKDFDSDEAISIEEAEGSSQERSNAEQRSEASDGIIENLDPIKLDVEFKIQETEDPPAISDPDPGEARARIIEEETRQFIVYSITGVFIIWTILSLVIFVRTGNTPMLLSDGAPFALFSIVVRHYFRES